MCQECFWKALVKTLKNVNMTQKPHFLTRQDTDICPEIYPRQTNTWSYWKCPAMDRLLCYLQMENWVF